ncbi:MAG: response regulator [Acidobacteria bacterium]|nr:response regulator [Acidobacteriota bacterium]
MRRPERVGPVGPDGPWPTGDALDTALARAVDGLVLVGEGGLVLAVNQAASAPLAHLGGSPGRRLPEPLLATIAQQGLRRVEVPAADGRTRLFECQAPADQGDGPALLVLRDVTDRLRLDRQAHQAETMVAVGRLAGGIAHDLNNILTAIVGFGTLVAEAVREHSDASQSAREVLDAAERATVLTRQLLAFGQRQVLHPTRVDVGQSVREALPGLQARLGPGATLEIIAPPQVPPVRVDEHQLVTVLEHLLDNAREAVRGQGAVTIEADDVVLDQPYCDTHVSVRPGHYVRLAVSDTGVGIPADVQPRVFEPFFTTKEKGTGSGLGLATVYGIVKQSGGYIWIYSQPGVGTTVKVYLPVDDSGRARPAAVVAAPGEAPETGTVLLVEDADAIRQLARDVLRRAGYCVLEASDAEQAVEMATTHDGAIDALVTDVIMPGASGVDLARTLAVHRPGLQVLYMSGYTDNAVVRNGLLADEAPFLQKPFTPRDLLEKVRQVFGATVSGVPQSKSESGP